MISKRILARNVLWNVGGMAVEAATAFFIAPFLVRELGPTRYGIWILIGSFAAYLGLLDLGVRGSVGRFLALHRAQNDFRKANEIVSTAMAICCPAGLLVLLACLAAQLFFFHLFDVPPAFILETRVTLGLMCLNLALLFPFNLFDGILWSEQRFDIINAIEMPSMILRAILCYVVVRLGYGISGQAFVLVIMLLLGASLKGFFGFRNDPSLRIGIRYINRDRAKELISYGSTRLVMTVARVSRLAMTNFLIGWGMSLATLTLYSISRRLVDYSESAVSAASGVITPLATALQAHKDEDRQKILFVQGGKFTSALSLCLLGFFASLGQHFITLWMGPKYANAGEMMMILALGETLPLCQLTTTNILLGIDKHRFLAVLMLIEVGFVIASGYILLGSSKLVSFCYTTAILGTIFRGLMPALYGCYALGVPFLTFLRESLVPAILVVMLPALAMIILTHEFPPTQWLVFFAYSLLYAIICGIACLALLDKATINSLWMRIQISFQGS